MVGVRRMIEIVRRRRLLGGKSIRGEDRLRALGGVAGGGSLRRPETIVVP